MPLLFNTTGPCVPTKHYILPAQERITELRPLIEAEQYFVIHAARQSGKTTLLLDLVQTLEASGDYRAVYVTVEAAHRVDDLERGIPAVIGALQSACRRLSWLPDGLPDFQQIVPTQRVEQALSFLAEECDRPLVLLIDEADCLGGETLISFLRQLRQGFVTRSVHPFPQSLALVGMRDLRDYRGHLRPDTQTLGSASPFNVVSESLTLRNFNRDEVGQLYAQHTAETQQEFPAAVVDLIFAQSQGQPWLVNAIARQIVEKELQQDTSQPISLEVARAAIQSLILRRDTHIDSLLERLREERVRRVVEPVILGEGLDFDWTSDDLRYCLDLGLLRRDPDGLRAACPIYAEVMARSLSYSYQSVLPHTLTHRWMSADSIDLDGLLRSFQQFWRENGDIWTTKYDYREAAPHLILMAYLQRVINGGAYIAREFATGRRRLDLDLQYAGRHYPIELKLYYGPKTRPDGEAQLADYCRSLGVNEGWLIIFDRRESRTWDEKISWDEIHVDNLHLRILGC